MSNIGIEGVRVGHAQDYEGGTGVSVIIFEEGACCGVSVTGGAPGTRETDLLDPSNLVDKVNAVVLSGGSAFGLDSVKGVMDYLEQNNLGFKTLEAYVPIVPAAVIYDLSYKSSKARPTAEMGYEACLNSLRGASWGNVGAGTGATVGKLLGIDNSFKSGIGYHLIEMPSGLKVAVIVAVNAFGSVFDLEGKLIAGPKSCGEIIDTEEAILKGANLKGFEGKNTTIACIITNANLDKAKARRVAINAQDGLARTIKPVHTLYDGDTIFVAGTGGYEEDLALVSLLSVKALEQAIINAVMNT